MQYAEQRVAAAQKIMDTFTKTATNMFASAFAKQAATQANVDENSQGGVTIDQTTRDVRTSNKVNVCKHCSSEDVSIHFKHNYYFYCNACNKNSPLKSLCATCGGVEIPHKKVKEFFLECKPCNTNRLFHVNS
jgi:hypothetical protein